MDLQKSDINGRGEYFINSGETNFGIKGKTDRAAKVFSANTITVDFFGNTYYRPFEYKLATHNHVFSLNGDIIKDERVGIYLASLFKYLKQKFSYSNMGTWPAIKELKISIPFSSGGEIAYDYMRSYIAELYKKNLNIINSYLEKNSLNECTLITDEEKALQQLERGEVHWKSFPLNTLFDPLKAPYLRKGTRRQDHISRICTKEFNLPVVCAKRGDNGIMKFGRKEDFTAHSNVLSIIYNGAIAAGLVYAHEEEVGIFTDSYLIKWKGEDIPFDVNLFLKTAIQKKIYPIYSREQKATWEKRVENEEIYLPINSDGKIDIEFMQAIVRAEKKLAAQKVIEYKNSLIEEISASTPHVSKPHIPNNHTSPSAGYELVEIPMDMAAEPFERYKWAGFDHNICDFFGGNQTILVGCYKGKKYQDWIHSHNIYNIRLGKTKGSMEVNRELFDSTSLLVLYELGKPDKLSAYEITGHHEITKDELIKLGYPNKKPRKRYMSFDITHLDLDLTFLSEHHLIERLVELNADNAKGTPVFIEP